MGGVVVGRELERSTLPERSSGIAEGGPPLGPLQPTTDSKSQMMPVMPGCCLADCTTRYDDLDSAEMFQKLFARPYFRVNLLPDPVRHGTVRHTAVFRCDVCHG